MSIPPRVGLQILVTTPHDAQGARHSQDMLFHWVGGGGKMGSQIFLG